MALDYSFHIDRTPEWNSFINKVTDALIERIEINTGFNLWCAVNGYPQTRIYFMYYVKNIRKAKQ